MKFSRFTLCIVFCSLGYNAVFSQNKQIDSLLVVLKSAKEDTNKVNALNLISMLFGDNGTKENGDSAFLYASQALALSKKLNYKKGTAVAYSRLGLALGRKGNDPESLKNLYLALKLFEEIGEKEGIANTLGQIGATYLNRDTEEALKNYQLALNIWLEIGNKRRATQLLTSIGQLYFGQRKYSLALEKLLAAFKTYKEMGTAAPAWGLPFTQGTIGQVYEGLGDSLLLAGDKTGARQKFYDAKTNLTEALKLWEKTDSRDGLAFINYALGRIHTRINDFSQARKYLQKSLQLSEEIKSVNYSIGCYHEFYYMDSIEGNYKQALEDYKQYISFSDSLGYKENIREIESYKTKYEVEKREDQIKILSTENKLKSTIASRQKQQKNFAFAGIAAILLGGGYGFYRYRRRKKLQKQQAVLNERLRISSELHDEVGATLSGIAMYSHLTKEQLKTGQIAEIEKSLNVMQQSSVQMVDKLNDIVWLINPEQDSLEKLIERLEEYATEMAAIKNMNVKVSVPDKIADIHLPVENRRNIYLFCKEAINNAVKYSNATQLELTVKEIDGKLEFSVSDNGKGFDAVMVRRGNGLENMQKRADEIGAKLVLQSKANEGASVSLRCQIT